MVDVYTILGVLLSLRHILTHLGDVRSTDSTAQMKGSFGAKFHESDVRLDVRQMIKVRLSS